MDGIWTIPCFNTYRGKDSMYSLSVMCVVRAKYMYLFLIPKTSQTEIHSIDSVCSISASNIGVKTSSYRSVVSVQCLTDIIL